MPSTQSPSDLAPIRSNYKNKVDYASVPKFPQLQKPESDVLQQRLDFEPRYYVERLLRSKFDAWQKDRIPSSTLIPPLDEHRFEDDDRDLTELRGPSR